MSWNASLFTSIHKVDIKVTIVDGSEVVVYRVGDVMLCIRAPGTTRGTSLIKVQGVYFMLDLNINLLSIARLENHSVFIRGRPRGTDLVYNRMTITTATRTRGSYALDLHKEIAYAS
jgi:hypothetical protein